MKRRRPAPGAPAGVGDGSERERHAALQGDLVLHVGVLNVGLDLGFIPEKAFTMFVLMALISTVMTAPGLRAWLPRIRHAIPVGVDA